MLRHATRHAEPAAVNGHDDDVCEVSTDFASIDDDVEMAAPEQDIPALPKSIADKFGKGLTIVRTASARMPRAMPVTADKVDEINSNRKPALRQSM
jgi:hypothetical protein